mmetsp:Transcript_38744/g.84290  ORF Transcript_38744/g.84290 Transcript_38744/m.84290 type:complete len:455 (-) Transcript_38744:244-1608(-)|eukprot:CAMPEP_0118921768 /NCGR_PEP_ID=MMETSP1169-20130426/942_1 /TAXON_ID=36882 /ORGANISM="Pyramimonas obovata, Strain CCMP722" /LENGTH=454 /DNA_ID=CAMNT_0006862549 /DNA_START=297 /DNA_END=1661 /DNA_ORIENTATION=-
MADGAGKEEEGTTELPELPSPSSRTNPSPLKGPSAKGSLHTRKSKSMLHDLQDYIKGVEAVANARKVELEKLYEERRDGERKERLKRAAIRSTENDYEKFSNMMDIPTKVRALYEDVKYQKNKVKRLKERYQDHEKTAAAQQQQLAILNEKLRVASESLAAVGKKPKQVLSERELMRKIPLKDEELRKLEHQLQVVMRSREVDLRRNKMDKMLDKREYDTLLEEVLAVKEDNEGKQMTIEEDALKIEALNKELEPLRALLEKLRPKPSPSNLFLTSLRENDDMEPEVIKDDRVVKLMLCVVEDDGKVCGKPIFTKAMRQAQAAVKIQAAARGFIARLMMRLAKAPKEEAEERERKMAEKVAEAAAAVTKIQAYHRGAMARQRVKKMKAEAEAKAKAEAEALAAAQAAEEAKAAKAAAPPPEKVEKKNRLSTSQTKPKGGMANRNAAKKMPSKKR